MCHGGRGNSKCALQSDSLSLNSILERPEPSLEVFRNCSRKFWPQKKSVFYHFVTCRVATREWAWPFILAVRLSHSLDFFPSEKTRSFDGFLTLSESEKGMCFSGCVLLNLFQSFRFVLPLEDKDPLCITIWLSCD